MWNNGALFTETAQKLILGKYFFSALSCTHNKLPSFLAMDRISELTRTEKATLILNIKTEFDYAKQSCWRPLYR